MNPDYNRFHSYASKEDTNNIFQEMNEEENLDNTMEWNRNQFSNYQPLQGSRNEDFIRSENPSNTYTYPPQQNQQRFYGQQNPNQEMIQEKRKRQPAKSSRKKRKKKQPTTRYPMTKMDRIARWVLIVSIILLAISIWICTGQILDMLNPV